MKTLRQVGLLLSRLLTILFVIELSLCFIRATAPDGHAYAPFLSLRSIFFPLDLHSSGWIDGKVVAVHILLSLWHAFFSVVYAILVGVFAGFFLIKIPQLGMLVRPVIDFFRAVPVTLLYPIAVISFNRYSDNLLILLGAIPCSAIMVFAVMRGITSIKPERVDIYKLNCNVQDGWRLFFDYTLPSIKPDFYSGVGFIISYSLVLACVLEMMGLGAQGSAGRVIAQALDDTGGNLSGVPLALILGLGLISYGLNALVNEIETKVGKHKF